MTSVAARRGCVHKTRALYWAAIASAILTVTTLGVVDSLPRETLDAAETVGPLVGTFTGQYVDGIPVYRLPPLIVVAEPYSWRDDGRSASASHSGSQGKAAPRT